MDWDYGRYKASLSLTLAGFLVKVSVEGVDSRLNGRYFLSFLVGDVQAHVLLHGDHQLDRVEGVKAQLLKSGSFGQLGLVTLGGTAQYLEHFGFHLLQ